MKISLEVVETKSNVYCYFNVMFNKSLHNTSSGVAKLLNVSIEQYNERLITRVIPDKKYEINDSNSSLSSGDLNFITEYVSPDNKQAYIELFKNEFAKELTTLALGGI